MICPRQSASRQRQCGFTLIEVMVAVIILAIGLLGLAGLQSSSLKFNHSAYLRTQATILAYDVLDAMRANINAARNGDYDVALGVIPPAGGTLASQDLNAWATNVAAALPGGQASVCRSPDGNVCGAGTQVIVTVQWVENRLEAQNPTGGALDFEPDVETFVTVTEL